jgi:hypothetical protein
MSIGFVSKDEKEPKKPLKASSYLPNHTYVLEAF